LNKITTITSRQNKLFPDLKELYSYRQLLFSLALRDIKVKYAQTYIGILWAFINPVFNLLVLSFVFGVVAKVNTNGLPQLLFTIAGLSAWTYFSTLLTEAGNSIVGAQNMIKKIYFPRLVIPLSKALSGLIDLGVTLICLIILMMYYKTLPGVQIIYLPLFVLLAIICGLAGGILISALSARYRDFSYVVPMLVRLGLYITPVAYSANSIPEKYKIFYYLNPMAGIVEGFRWSLFGSESPDQYMIISIVVALMLFVASLIYFAKIEHKLADII